MRHSRLLSFILIILVAASCRNSVRTNQAFVSFAPTLNCDCVGHDDLADLFPKELIDSQVTEDRHEIGSVISALPLTAGNRIRVADTCRRAKQVAVLFSNGNRIMMTLNAKGLLGWQRTWHSELFQGGIKSQIRAIDFNCDSTPEIVASFQLGHFYESTVIYTFDGDSLVRMHEPIQYINRSILFGNISYYASDTGTTVVVGAAGPMRLINTYFIGRGSKALKFISTVSPWPTLREVGDST